MLRIRLIVFVLSHRSRKTAPIQRLKGIRGSVRHSAAAGAERLKGIAFGSRVEPIQIGQGDDHAVVSAAGLDHPGYPDHGAVSALVGDPKLYDTMVDNRTTNAQAISSSSFSFQRFVLYSKQII